MASLYNSLPGRVKDIKNLKEYVKAQRVCDGKEDLLF
jgi:hypothetical protein